MKLTGFESNKINSEMVNHLATTICLIVKNALMK